MKRFLDVCVAALALVVLSPLLVVVSVLVLLAQGPPVVFAQSRPGLGGRLFRIYKFRTMRNALDARGKPLHDAARLTGVGRMLRSTSLDELPELWNVLRGDMSLVGPRPLLPEYLPLYSEVHRRRHEVRPGLTGWAQVNGRNAVGWPERLDMDVWYVDNRSLWLDLRILALTVAAVLGRRGISQPGQATMEAFRGYDP